MTKKYIHKVTKEVAVPCPDWRYILNSSLVYIPESILTSGNDWEVIEKDNRHSWRYWYPNDNSHKSYYIDDNWSIKERDKYALNAIYAGNIFQTKEEAEKELAKRKAIVTIKRYISDTFGVFEPDWSDKDQNKYWILYNHQDNKFTIDWFKYYDNCSPIWYLSCQKHTREIIEKFDTELGIIFDIK